MLNMMNKTKAKELFHNKENNWNCAQAIIKSRQDILNISDENIELHYRSKGGGRAENGICGAIYAATKLMSEEEAQRFIAQAEKDLGASTCKGLKGELKVACPGIVNYVDEKLEESKID